MGSRRAELREGDLRGFKLLEPVSRLLEALRDEADSNRNLYFDHYVTLLLFYFYNPTLASLRGLQASTEFPKVRKKLGVPRTSLGSLSAAQHAFSADELRDVLAELVKQVPADKGDVRLSALKEAVTVVDGTLLKTLPRVAWALWLNNGKRALKAHVQFEVLRATPSRVEITAGNEDERVVLDKNLDADRLYVLDSGYAKYALFQAILDVGSNFVCRLPTGWTYEAIEERELTAEDREARVVRDVVVSLGTANRKLDRKVRIVEIEKVEEPSKRMRRERPVREKIVIVTDRMDLSAEVIAVLYSSRWQIEIFFRWLKCTLGCKQLLAESKEGATLQFYSALIACLLITLWLGRTPTKRMFEAVCFYLQGWAEVDDVLAVARRLKPITA